MYLYILTIWLNYAHLDYHCRRQNRLCCFFVQLKHIIPCNYIFVFLHMKRFAISVVACCQHLHAVFQFVVFICLSHICRFA